MRGVKGKQVWKLFGLSNAPLGSEVFIGCTIRYRYP